jgi:hypothetical protein
MTDQVVTENFPTKKRRDNPRIRRQQDGACARDDDRVRIRGERAGAPFDGADVLR